MKKFQKKLLPFTLIEILLTMALFSLLLNALFFWYRHFQSSHRVLNDEKWFSLEERYAQQQLEDLFLHVENNALFFTPSKEDSGIDGQSLVFIFDNGPNADPLLSNKVLGRLFIDSHQHTLCLGIWPHPKKEIQTPSRTFILLNNVEALKFHFYFPPDPFKKGVDPREIGHAVPEEKWQTHWKKEYDLLPPLIKMEMNRLNDKKNISLKYAFDLSQSPCNIIFKQDPAS